MFYYKKNFLLQINANIFRQIKMKIFGFCFYYKLFVFIVCYHCYNDLFFNLYELFTNSISDNNTRSPVNSFFEFRFLILFLLLILFHHLLVVVLVLYQQILLHLLLVLWVVYYHFFLYHLILLLKTIHHNRNL